MDESGGAVPSGLDFVSVFLCGNFYGSLVDIHVDLERSFSHVLHARPVLEGMSVNKKECIVEIKCLWGDCFVHNDSKGERGLETLNYLSSECI